MAKYLKIVLGMPLLLLLVVTAPPANATNKATGHIAAFHIFWTQFRQAVIRNDQAAILRMTRFPFRTRGEMDSMPVLMHNRAALQKMWPALLKQLSGRSVSETQKTMILRLAKIPVQDGRSPGVSTDGKTARVGNFEFERTAQGWKFVFAYTSE